MAVHICGNSHVAALRKGQEKLNQDRYRDILIFPLAGAMFELSPFSKGLADAVTFTEKRFVNNLHQYTRLNQIDATHYWGFTMGNRHSRLYADRLWSEAEPAEICSSGMRPITSGQLTAMIENGQTHTQQFFLQLKSAGVRFFAIAAPFPRQDACGARNIRPETLLYVNNAACNLHRNWLMSHNIDYVEPPPQCLDEQGFLKAEYGSEVKPNGLKDYHHANADYGALMMERIGDFLAAKTSAV
jgi:hypothetical protein